MIDYKLVDIKPISKEVFNKINNMLENDSSVSQFVSFSYYALITNGIFYNERLVGLLNLSYYIENNIAISIALLKEYRSMGITKIVAEKIIEYYGNMFSNSGMFIFNCLPSNEKAILAFQAMGLKQTHEFDEAIFLEGADFFYNFYKENPYRKLEVK